MKEKDFENLEVADEIDYLPWPDCIKVRPDTYIGGRDYAAMCVLLREIFNNSADECTHTANKIIVERDFNGLALIADNGRGISIEYNKKVPGVISADLSISSMHSGSKFPGNTAKAKSPTSGKNGLGSSAVNALSSDYILLSWITPLNYDKSLPEVKQLWESTKTKKDLFYIVWYKQGHKVYEGALKKKDIEKMIFGNFPSYKEIPSGMSTIVMFSPDPDIFKESAKVSNETKTPLNIMMNMQMENYQYFLLVAEKFLKKKITLIIDGQVMTQSGFKGFNYEFIKSVVPKDTSLNPMVDFFISFDADGDLNSKKNTYFGSVNYLVVNTGIHLDWVEYCYSEALKSYFKLDGIPDRYLSNGLRLCVVARGAETLFKSQTKDELGGFPGLTKADMSPIIKEFQKVFKKDPVYWEKHVANLTKYVDDIKSYSASAKANKMMTTNTSSFYIKGEQIKGFADATIKDRTKAEAFFCEGLSAAAGQKGGRMVDPVLGGIPQAIVPLRGKILNVKDSSITKALENKEILTIFNLIGVGIGQHNCINKEGAKTYEEAHEALLKYSKFGKLIISTDGDPDGSHIQNLLLYLFAKFAPFLIEHGMVYICKAPLFYQDGKYFFPGDPLQPGTPFPVGLDQRKKYSRWKGLGSIPKDKIYDSFFNPATRRLVQVTPDGINYGMSLVEDIVARKNLLTSSGIISNPFNIVFDKKKK